jgi:hypothetical protein
VLELIEYYNGKIPTFMDLGASDTMFVSRDVFDVYKATQPRSGDSAKAIDGEFEIVGEGIVNKRSLSLLSSGFASEPDK